MKVLDFLVRARLFSPGGFLLRAAVISALFLAAHATGLRAFTSIISGTLPTGKPADTGTILLGVAYIVLWFLFVVAVPVFIIGSGIFFALVLRPKCRHRHRC